MLKLGVKKNNLLKFAGFVGALFLIVFGNLANFLRTFRLVEEKRKNPSSLKLRKGDEN